MFDPVLVILLKIPCNAFWSSWLFTCFVFFGEEKDKHNKPFILFRPGLIQFLEKMKNLFEIVLYTLKPISYAEPIVRTIEENKFYFEHKIYRNNISNYSSIWKSSF